jgi:UDP-4-amino-4,6-dideoxy-N-acetyl-beta-L-altrosamine transaminase
LIPYARQSISREDIEAVTAVLRSDFLTQGPVVPRFEEAVAARTGARHAVAVNSATSALHIACLALDLGPGDRLWTSPNTFVASANCGLYCGATVDFVDIEPDTGNLSVSALADQLQRAASAGTLPKVVVPVHFAGQPTDQEAIFGLSREYGFRVLEDASHSIGARRNSAPVGSCRWSDVTVFSFHPVKIITTGEGGMALTNDAEVAHRMAMLRTHGITRDAGLMGEANPPAWSYEQQVLGFNYRMTDLQAALGLSQLERIDAFVTRRRDIAARYDEALRSCAVRRPHVTAENRSAHHLYVIRVAHQIRRSLFESMRAAGVGVNVHYTPVHLQPYYRVRGFSDGLCPEAERHGREAVTLPLYADLSVDDQDRVIEILREVLATAQPAATV